MSSDLLPAVRGAIARVVDPCSIATGAPIDLIEMGLLEDLEVEDGHVRVTLRLTSPFCWQATNIIDAVKEFVGEVDGVVEVTCEIDPAAEWMPDMIGSDAQARLRRVRPLAARSGTDHLSVRRRSRQGGTPLRENDVDARRGSRPPL